MLLVLPGQGTTLPCPNTPMALCIGELTWILEQSPAVVGGGGGVLLGGGGGTAERGVC